MHVENYENLSRSKKRRKCAHEKAKAEVDVGAVETTDKDKGGLEALTCKGGTACLRLQSRSLKLRWKARIGSRLGL